MFGRYSLGDFLRDGPQMFGTGGGDELVEPRRRLRCAQPEPGVRRGLRVVSITAGRLPVRLVQVPRQRAAVGLRHHSRDRDAGIPGLNLDNTFASGMPAFFIGGDTDSRRMAFGSGLGDRVGRCNCPLDEDEQQFQVVGNVTKLMGNHSIKFGVDVRRAYNLRVPSDRHRSGELNFEND